MSLRSGLNWLSIGLNWLSSHLVLVVESGCVKIPEFDWPFIPELANKNELFVRS